ncbi:putative glutamine amidotransferase [Thalassobacillus cyri]|uniref:Putative glutamine amidotransferase n=1 Tax=Thalassobacillus cyri TaxID=571932 RepID=A0A1H3Y0Y6_9BACI|nr:gamma-glutamyl-gamma-aminobutyrate hydrolase family protein [Thalassobacillus cyri]SEA05385.1 putative glutamine amidotransferase [Thalassobacillus cyri]
MEKIIGVGAGISRDEGGPFPGYRRYFANEDYIEAVYASGGLPFILPVLDSEDAIKRQVESIDGLLLTGGNDVNPLKYGEEPVLMEHPPYPERDNAELLLVKETVRQEKPVLGFCRGIHILNVAFGGTLYQDISHKDGETIEHNQYSNGNMVSHTITFDQESRFYDIFGEEFQVNSFHHQAVKDVADGFRATAEAKDGIVEVIEKKDKDNFVTGIQFHPELFEADHERMRKVFDIFVSYAGK